MTLPRLDAYDALRWPWYQDGDVRGEASDSAFDLISRNQWVPGDRWRDWTNTQRQAWPSLVLRCRQPKHRDRPEERGVPAGGYPNVAEVWQTPQGLLFASRVAGIVDEHFWDAHRPQEPPTAVLGVEARIERGRRLGPRPRTSGALMRPIVVIRVLLPKEPSESLFAKCTVCGPYQIDETRIIQCLATASQVRSEHDGGRPYEVDVLQVSNPIL